VRNSQRSLILVPSAVDGWFPAVAGTVCLVLYLAQRRRIYLSDLGSLRGGYVDSGLLVCDGMWTYW
jgi:hypothetical protein